MYKTIAIGSNILVQGIPEQIIPDGRIIIRIGDRKVQGWPVNHEHECRNLMPSKPSTMPTGAS